MRSTITFSWWRMMSVWFVILGLLHVPGSDSTARVSTGHVDAEIVAASTGDRAALMATQAEPVRVVRPERSDERPAEPFALLLSRLLSTHRPEAAWTARMQIVRQPRLFGGLVGVIELRI